MRRMRALFAAIAVALTSVGLSLGAVAQASEARAEQRRGAVEETSAMSVAGGVAGSVGAIMLAIGGSSVVGRALGGVRPD